ncbi:hypothetical protein UYSO10_2758 [Kosakonia radicincitans]|nr:hypothetical protein UYSO10_2758 [Kosakonia radicincitans]
MVEFCAEITICLELPPAQLRSGHGDNCHNQHNDGCLSHENSFTGDIRQK